MGKKFDNLEILKNLLNEPGNSSYWKNFLRNMKDFAVTKLKMRPSDDIFFAKINQSKDNRSWNVTYLLIMKFLFSYEVIKSFNYHCEDRASATQAFLSFSFY